MVSTDDIIKVYNSGRSCTETATILHTTKRVVLLRLKKAGIQRRTLSQSLRKYILDTTFFKTINTEAKAYWLGFLLADANIGYNGRNGKSKTLRCTLQRRDRGHLEKFVASILSNMPVIDIIATNKKSKKQHQASLLRINSIELCNDLEGLGWQEFKRNGDTKILDITPSHLIKHLVRGLIDGDGWISYSKDRWVVGYCDLHKSVVEWVKKWLNAGGSKTRQAKNNKSYKISYTGKTQTHRIIKILYGDCSIALDRKLANAMIVQDLLD